MNAHTPDLGRIGFSEDQGALLEVATAFCRERSPISTVRRLITDELGHDGAVWSEMAALGWLGIAIPEDLGGSGLGLAEVAPVMEQMGRTLLAGPFASTTLAAQAILVAGTVTQKQAWAPRLATGAIAALALAEADGDGVVDAPRCAAEPAGAGRLVLSGGKVLVENAAAADVILASVRHAGRPALVLIEPPGDAALRREAIIDETRRAYALDLTGLEIPADAVLDGDRTAQALARLHLAANLLAAAEMCGGTQAAIDDTVDYAKTRRQFGQAIGAYQGVKHPLVEAYLAYEQARSHLYAAAHSFETPRIGEIAVRMARVAAEGAFAFAADRAIQFHGGFGFTYDCDAQLYRRRALWCAARHGDIGFHKKKLADLLLGETRP